MAHNLARWTARIGPQIVTTKTLSSPWPDGHPLGTPDHPASSPAWPWETQQSSPGPTASHSTPSLSARPLLTRHPANRTPRQLAPVRSERPCPIPPSPSPQPLKPPSAPPKASADRRQPPVYPPRMACNFLTPLPLSSPSPVDSGLDLTPVGLRWLVFGRFRPGRQDLMGREDSSLPLVLEL